MNQLLGSITAISSSGNVSLVDMETAGISMSAIVIGTPENTSYLRLEKKIWILFKESEVSIGKNFSGSISLRNQIDSTIVVIEKGDIFAKIGLEFNDLQITSLITSRSANKLELKIGDKVTAFIKANEVLIMDTDDE